jgi:hypothetical protein
VVAAVEFSGTLKIGYRVDIGLLNIALLPFFG